MNAVGPGKRVSLHFSVALSSGEQLDSTHERSEPAFEAAIEGMKAGEQGRFVIANGFGEWNEDSVQHFPRHQFGEQLLEPGMVMHFADASGAELPGIIKDLPEGIVVVDFNHPLAGRELVFSVDILRVMDADASAVTLN